MGDRRRPLIAVAGRVFPLGRIDRVLEPQVAVPTWYVESVNRAGGLGVVVLPEPGSAAGASAGPEATMDRCDGLVLTGGIDVDPSLYGQEPDPHTYGCDLTTDRYDLGLLRAALESGKPVLAICRGMQLVDVAFGGTLHQHIEPGPDGIRHGIPNGGGGSEVAYAIEAGSLLAEVMEVTEAVGRCHHHQAVDRVGDGLVVSARAGDGGVEGLEPAPGVRWPGASAPLVEPWLVAVQWHPEETTHADVTQQRLFDRLVDRAAEVATDRAAPA